MYAEAVEATDIRGVAPLLFEQKNQGSALQAAAFRQRDLLPLYGSSELEIVDPYHASTLFRAYPTGFTIFPVGKPGSTCLLILQKLAAAGGDLRGKKVAISLSPGWFVNGYTLDPHAYAANFSRLDAAALTWDAGLSFALKAAAARRLLAFPDTLAGDPLLQFGLQQLADGSPAATALYYAALPLGWLQTLVLRLQDHWATLQILNKGGLNRASPRQPAALDWPALLDAATQEYTRESSSNRFGFANDFWATSAGEIQRQVHIRDDRTYYGILNGSTEWTDLDLLLRELRELGAQPLVLSMPIKGIYFSFLGVSTPARQAYYTKLRQAVAPYHVPLLDFADHDADKLFLIDSSSHLSPRGWVYFDRAFDAFFHGTLPPP